MNFFVVLFSKMIPKSTGNPKIKMTRTAVITGPRETIEKLKATRGIKVAQMRKNVTNEIILFIFQNV